MIITLSPTPPTAPYDGSSSADMAQGGIQMDGLWFMYAGNQCVGDFVIEKHSTTQWSLHPSVAKEFRRQKVASALYDYIQIVAHNNSAQIIPSDHLSPDAQSFWAHRSRSSTHTNNAHPVHSITPDPVFEHQMSIRLTHSEIIKNFSLDPETSFSQKLEDFRSQTQEPLPSPVPPFPPRS